MRIISFAKRFAPHCCLLMGLLMWPHLAVAQKGLYVTADQFRDQWFSVEQPWETLWINAEIRQTIETIRNEPFRGLRVRYWGAGTRTGWILEEIGKEMPITVGVIIEDHEIKNITVMEYRESRGGEVKYDFFTEQFDGAHLDEKHKLDREIDGITGATLSVHAMKKIARTALYCHTQTPFAANSASVANR